MTDTRHPTPSAPPEGSPIPRRCRAAALALGALLLVGACTSGSSPAATPTPAASATSIPSPTPTPGPTQAPFPLTVRDDEGTSVTIPARPQRIVSLSPANTEIVWALGAGDRQVGGTDADDFPAEAAGLPDVVKRIVVDVESIVALEADLVLASGGGFTSPDAVQRLRTLGLPVVVVYAADVPGVLADIELIGSVIGETPAAVEMTDAMRSRIEAVSDATGRAAARPRTFYELDATGAIFGPADASFVVGMIELAGGTPVTTGSTTVYQISLERLVAADPEVILLGDAAYGVTADIVAARPGWEGMTAVREGAIYPVDDIVVTRPGPRLVEGLLALVRAIHPELGL
jgi:iron complex transport system substrate-binding protein